MRVDRTRKVPITVLIRALGVGTNDEIRELFGDEPKIEASFSKDVSTNYQEGLFRVIQKDPSRRTACGGQRGKPDHQHVF